MKTAWGMKVDIPNCTVCDKWLGKGFNGNVIQKGSCGHFYHQNCAKNECAKKWKVEDSVDLRATEWWNVEKFWEYFKT